MSNRYKGKPINKLMDVDPLDCNATETEYISKRLKDHYSSLLAEMRYYEQKKKESEMIAKAKDEVHEYYKPIIKEYQDIADRMFELFDEVVEIGMNEGKEAVREYINLQREKDKLNFKDKDLRRTPVANIKSQQHYKPKKKKDRWNEQFDLLVSVQIPPNTLTQKQQKYWKSIVVNRGVLEEVAKDMNVKIAQVKSMYRLIIPKIAKHVKNN